MNQTCSRCNFQRAEGKQSCQTCGHQENSRKLQVVQEMATEAYYDHQLAQALDMDILDNNTGITRMINTSMKIVSEFQADMAELGQKLQSASRKLNALIFMDAELLQAESVEAPLSYAGILLQEPEDVVAKYAPASLPIAMVKDTADAERIESAALRSELKQQLRWFQEFGKNGLLVEAVSKGNDKSKRHLSVVSDQVKAA